MTSDTGGSMKLISLLRSWSNVLCGLLYLAGVVYFGCLVYPAFNAKTYFSENALLPGLVDEEFMRPPAMNTFMKDLSKLSKSTSKQKYQTYHSINTSNIFLYLEFSSFQQHPARRLAVERVHIGRSGGLCSELYIAFARRLFPAIAGSERVRDPASASWVVNGGRGSGVSF